jgi:hypothetical protein
MHHFFAHYANVFRACGVDRGPVANRSGYSLGRPEMAYVECKAAIPQNYTGKMLDCREIRVIP